ncbi:hypothetical protein GQX74_002964 [Glossina fuscipes]|nr:hypothetical protein GQX74_002964 [Glossina fuscipes]
MMNMYAKQISDRPMDKMKSSHNLTLIRDNSIVASKSMMNKRNLHCVDLLGASKSAEIGDKKRALLFLVGTSMLEFDKHSSSYVRTANYLAEPSTLKTNFKWLRSGALVCKGLNNNERFLSSEQLSLHNNIQHAQHSKQQDIVSL